VWGKKCQYKTLSLSPVLPCPFSPSSSLLSHFFHVFLSLPFVSIPLPGGPFSQIPLWNLWERCESHSGSGGSRADKPFLMHSVLKITLPVIALWHKFSDNHACIVLRPGYVTYQNGTVFLRKKNVAVLFPTTKEMPVWPYGILSYTVPLSAMLVVYSIITCRKQH